jgi:DNA-binding NtrC family response regulator
MTQRVLIVDDDSAFRSVYSSLLATEGYAIEQADDRPSARAVFAQASPDVVLLDLMLPPDGSVQGGLELLAELLASRPGAKIIVVSGVGDTSFMLDAVRRGAYDFLTKPADPDVVLVVVARAMARAALEARVDRLQHELSERAPASSMIGKSPAFLDAVSLAERVAPTDLPVLVTGENGTGKELMARAIHDRSHRAANAFLPINCGALTESLLESTLFGHVKGAFTGASSARDGLLLQADGGTVFLDEIGDMPPALQVKLLRAIEYGEILPVGADRPAQVDVRVVSATHRDLLALQAEGTFREDLYWRIKGAQVHLPPLRERPEDIPLLATHFLNQAASYCPDGRPRRLTPEAEAALSRHTWPGNMRELRHEMQRASVLAGSSLLLAPSDFSFAQPSFTSATSAHPTTLQEKITLLERQEIAAALAQHDGNRTRAAADLGLSRQGLLNKIERYGLS